MKNLNEFITESKNPVKDKYPNVLKLGNGEFDGILWGHCFLYEGNKYYSECGWRNVYPSYCKLTINEEGVFANQVDQYQHKDLKKLF